jgi:hypothetical protein
VSFSPPPGITPPQDAKITDALVNADYLINMPIMKRHPIAGASLSFKNHFGTIRDPDWLHDYIDLDGASYRSDYSPYIELYQSPNIMGKTVLTIGDGLFAAKFFNQAPVLWDSFGNQVPNSLFFSTDCVALDSIMCDLLDIEFGVPAGTDDCLHLAGDAGLGVFERGDPWGSGYSQIDYVRSDL